MRDRAGGRRTTKKKSTAQARATTDDAADEPNEPSGALFPIVGIGASAGGLEAFRQLLGALPRKTGMGFVLVQHLDPDHESALTEILSRATSLPVREITNDERVLVDHLYVIPPDTNLTIAAGVLRIQRHQRTGAPHRSIDAFFQSLAQDQRERAVGVVLSGTANDGTMGLEAIKAEGGITFAQDDSAAHDSMPRSAVSAGCVDLVLSPADIAKELVRIAKHPYVAGQSVITRAQADQVHADTDGGREEGAGADDASGYEKILLLLRSHSGVDFSLYKPTTIQRRLARRVVVNKQSTLHDYASFLHGNAKELDALYSDVLISVTSFFRNPETFDVLQGKILPELLEQRGDDPLRFWVLACSTGQEAYSIAMAFVEAAEKAHRTRELQVFATDLNEAMLETARRGLYAKSLVADLTPQRLQRFFVETDGGYRIHKTLRDRVIFARQDLTADPPFSRVDLISCRNVLIYLEPSAQKKAMTTFHYALKPGGRLLLGASESIGRFAHLFEPVDKKHKIYSKKQASIQAGEAPPAWRTRDPNRRPVGPELPEASAGELDPQREADRITVGQFAPPGVLVNAELQVLQFRGETGAFLEPPTGKPSFDVLKMARNGLMLPLRSAINQARKESKTARKENARFKQNGKTRSVNLVVIPLKKLRERCFLILFEEVEKASRGNEPSEPQRARAHRSPSEKKSRIAELETELSETREYLQAIQEQLETSNEEFQASNEEVQSANEELQSSNEELQTSKEELESTNEELTTINDELSNRNIELNRANSDLLNLQASARVAIMLLGHNLNILRFGPHAEKQFHLREGDIGRPIGDLQHNLVLGDAPESALDLESFCAEVVSSAREQEREVRDKGGRWYSVRVRPNRTLDDHLDGALIVVVDIDTLKRSEQAVRESEAQSAADAAALAKLNELSSRLWQMRSLREGLAEMLGSTIDLLGADMGNIQLLDEQRGVLRIEAQRGFKQDFLDFFREVSTEDDSACGRTLRAGERTIIEDVETDAPYAPLRSVARAAGYRAVQSTPLKDRNGAPLGMISTHFRSPHRPSDQELRRLDLYARQAAGFIERCNAENALGKSEEKYRSLFDSMDEGFATCEVLFDSDDKAIDYVILETNPAHEKMSGMPRTFVGKRVREVMPTIEEGMIERVGRVALTGEPIRFEEYVSGLGRWFEIYLSRVGGEGSRTVASLANNITERKRREHHAAFLDKLSQSLALLESPEEIVRAAGEALGADLGLSYFHLADVNLSPGSEPAEARITVLATWEREGFFKASGSYRAGDYLSGEFLRACRAGETVAVRDTDDDPWSDAAAYRAIGIRAYVAIPILKDGEWPGLIAVGTSGPRDWRPDEVTLLVEVAHRVFPRFERARADAALRASRAELTEADRRKNEFLAMLGHELRNPLSALTHALELLGKVRDDRARLEELLGMMGRQTKRMASLLDQLLDIARVITGKVELSRSCIDLADVVRAAVETMKPLVESHRHKLTLSLPPEKSALVLGDAVRLTQVVENLLTNAAKYTDEGGQIALTLEADKDKVRIKIRDTGIGISADLLPHIFEVFTQASRTLDRAKGGMGLGLPLVRRLVDLHEGQVNVSSPGPDQGSEFIVTLPRLLERPPQERPEREPLPEPGKVLSRRILVVDDEENMAWMFARLLKEDGHQTLAVNDGPAALAAIRTFRPEVVLLDLGLPQMDGYEVAKRIRDEHGDKILLIAVTGYQKDASRLKEAGFDDHLIKPPDMQKLSSLLAALGKENGPFRDRP